MEAWGANRVTQMFLKYLSDVRQSIVDGHLEVLDSGGIISEDYQRVESGKILMLGDISEIDLEDIEFFYDKGEIDV